MLHDQPPKQIIYVFLKCLNRNITSGIVKKSKKTAAHPSLHAHLCYDLVGILAMEHCIVINV